ncbi:Integrin alpha ina-1 [Trichinella pseudospiralis]|uniref:Integrin alpha ina-1 n=1 Tax=Trichinella pseudospiralis TaxID=6337 RepID=A0A0V1EKN9_TRIPS|nr:Integrin alpha ina-1 [Trichinella pseudospiralis]
MDAEYTYLSCIILHILNFCTSSLAFNLDTDMPVYKIGPKGSYFGFAVAEHMKGDEPLILIGAPKAESGQVGTKHAGAMFACPVNSVFNNASETSTSKWCQNSRVEYPSFAFDEVDFYKHAPNEVRPEDIYTKDHQWLGSTIRSSGRGSRVLVCAPNLIYGSAAYIEGACFLLKNDLTHVKRIRTCQFFTKKNRHNDYSVCQEGFSATLDEKYQVIATGLPGASRWIGGIFAQDVDEHLSTLHARWTPMVRGNHTVENVIKAHSYFGYSTAVGIFGFAHENFKPNGNFTLVAGCPRCNDTGAVYFLPFYKEVTVDQYSALRLFHDHVNLTGDDSFASGFGYSITVMDIDQDGFDDLIVGAPYHYNFSSTKPTGGRVYVYFSSGKVQPSDKNEFVFKEPIRLSGQMDSMFGAATANLGDLNQDNFNDLAVGAPYDEKGGAVYIYFGSSAESFDSKPMQIIRGIELKITNALLNPIQTFGWSLSGGLDMDNNGYPDLLVGAFKSDMAILLRARPIVHIVTTVEEEDLKPIDLDHQRCKNYWEKVCFKFRTKLRIRRQTIGSQLDFTRNILLCRLEVLRYGSALKRAEFSGKFNYYKEWPCGRGAVDSAQIEEHELFIRDTNRDWLNPLKFVFSVALLTDKSKSTTSPLSTIPNINDYPVLDKIGSKTEFTLEFNKKCGNDDQCISDLVLNCLLVNLAKEASSDMYVKQVGKDDELDLHYRVTNKGERAYESSLFVKYNENELERPMLLQKSHNLLNFGKLKNGLIEVLLGNPLEPNAEVVFQLKFKLTRGRSETLGQPLVFESFVNSTSTEVDESNNRCKVAVKVIKKAELEIVGISKPKLVYFGGKVFGESSVFYEEDIGPQVIHTYLVKNSGPWGVSDVTVMIEHPHQIYSPYARGKWALYLMYTPVIELPIPGSAVRKGLYLFIGLHLLFYFQITETRNCYVDLMAEHVNSLDVKIGSAEDDGMSVWEKPTRKSSSKYTTTALQFVQSLRDFRIRQELVNIDGETYKRVVVVFFVFSNCNKQPEKRTAKCFPIRCIIDHLEPNITATIRILSRLWNSTFVEDYRDVDHVLIESRAWIEVDRRQGIEETNYLDNEATAVTRAQPDMPQIEEKLKIPLWIIILAVLGGIFLLMLITVLLWKCGFFKRGKYYDQPLYKAEYKHSEDID